MTLREIKEQREHQFLSPFASFSDMSKGRDVDEEQCDIRTVYQRDRDRILHAKSFRRLNAKTQVFLSPEGDHYRTRLTHTLEVAQTARTIANALLLNEDLTEAIALGHDLGHTPFGHAGERALNEVCEGGFQHHVQSVRVVEHLEKHGEGLNLTYEVRDGILNHQSTGHPSTLEGDIVKYSDKIAYINHDIDDAIRAHIITESDIPLKYKEILGNSLSERLNTLIHDIVFNSEGKDHIVMTDRVYDAMYGLRDYMYKNVYTNAVAKGQEAKAEELVKQLYRYYMTHVEQLPDEYRCMVDSGKEKADNVVCDYIAGMTDRYAISKYKELMIPLSWDIF